MHRDLICDLDHFSSLWAEKQYLVPRDYVPGQQDTGAMRHSSTCYSSSINPTGIRHTYDCREHGSLAAFMARESSAHTPCQCRVFAWWKEERRCAYDTLLLLILLRLHYWGYSETAVSTIHLSPVSAFLYLNQYSSDSHLSLNLAAPGQLNYANIQAILMWTLLFSNCFS